MHWIKMLHARFQSLQHMARTYTHILATSVPSERGASVAGRIDTPKRSSLGLDLFSDIMVVATHAPPLSELTKFMDDMADIVVNDAGGIAPGDLDE